MDAATLHRWAQRLCEIPSTRSETVLFVLGVRGEQVPYFSDLLVQPPPLGASELRVSEREGELFTLEVIPAETNPITVADLAAHFGPGQDVVRVHWNDPHPLCHHVELPGAPHYCDLFAYFPGRPTETSRALRLMLRRQSLRPS